MINHSLIKAILQRAKISSFMYKDPRQSLLELTESCKEWPDRMPLGQFSSQPHAPTQAHVGPSLGRMKCVANRIGACSLAQFIRPIELTGTFKNWGI